MPPENDRQAQHLLQAARQMILDEAEKLGLSPLTEATKWGQPAFLTQRGQGTTIRLGLSGGKAALFVHCQTTIIAEARAVFGDAAFEGNRACLLDGTDETVIRSVIRHALTYHNRKR